MAMALFCMYARNVRELGLAKRNVVPIIKYPFSEMIVPVILRKEKFITISPSTESVCHGRSLRLCGRRQNTTGLPVDE